MTTPTRPRPTPLDLANRHANRALTRAGDRLASDEPFRVLWERGIRRSTLTPHHRLVALTLASHADYTTGEIPKSQQPYLGGLVTETGLKAGQIAVALTVLLERGWIRRAARDQHRAYEKTPLRLAIPALLLDGLRRS